jgi:hypothetical protein
VSNCACSTLGWLQLLSLASLALYALCKAIRRRSKPSRRLSLAPLQSVLCEKVLPSKDLPDAISRLFCPCRASLKRWSRLGNHAIGAWQATFQLFDPSDHVVCGFAYCHTMG